MTPPRCPYCGEPARLVSGREVYPHRADLAVRRYWLCVRDDAWAGADIGNGFIPTGTMANAELRAARAQAHATFDPLWKSGGMSRNAAYRWLAGELGLPKAAVHISRFDLSLCRKVVEAVHRRQPRAAE